MVFHLRWNEFFRAEDALQQHVALFSQLRSTPNLLTLLRLFIVPFIVNEILDGDYRIAFGLLFLAGLTDMLDGLLARRLGQKTWLGQYLDPIADKLLLSTLFLVLTHVNVIPRYVTVLVFSRDLGIILIATLLYVTGALREFHPSKLGKFNTAFQILGLVVVMLERLCTTSGWEAATKILTPLAYGNFGLLRLIAVLAPLSAAEYGWIVLRRIDTPPAAV